MNEHERKKRQVLLIAFIVFSIIMFTWFQYQKSINRESGKATSSFFTELFRSEGELLTEPFTTMREETQKALEDERLQELIDALNREVATSTATSSQATSTARQ